MYWRGRRILAERGTRRAMAASANWVLTLSYAKLRTPSVAICPLSLLQLHRNLQAKLYPTIVPTG